MPIINDVTYDVESIIGSGTYADIYRAVERNIGRGMPKYVCLKHLKTYDKADKVETVQAARRAASREIAALKIAARIPCPYLRKYLNHGRDEHGKYYLVTDFFLGINVGEWIKQTRSNARTLPALTIINIARMLAEGLAAMHENGLVHRDLKPANLLYGNEKNVPTLRIIDLGFAVWEAEGVIDVRMFTPLYNAPEFVGRVLADFTATKAADIWAYGLIIYELIFLHSPFKANTIVELHDEVVRPLAIPKIEHPLLARIIEATLQCQPELRPTAHMLKEWCQAGSAK